MLNWKNPLVVGMASRRMVADAPSAAADIRGEEVSYEANGVVLKGYVAWDAALSGPCPAVLVVHEWWGLSDYVRGRARMLAELGYVALAVDMYGQGQTAATPDEARALMMSVMGNLVEARARFVAGMRYLQSRPDVDGARLATFGYCFGGAVGLHMARAGLDLKGVVCFHSNLSTQTPARAGEVKARVLVTHGAADPLVPETMVEAFHAEMKAAGVDYQFIAYPGVRHAFTNPEATAKGEKLGMPLAYDEGADKDSWRRAQAFLQEVFTV